ncbi:uncharacterized protein LOC126906731 isoform X2 [Daktulosphaira vitifoliae]|uniref:uncharacterized protein LOC126906731 isoform X2 n=1 Tax=Daktulosphaira vitifoliae TaxID=58002 RepID=UPI0021AA2F5F|nr:uncharacterized protein LOC126906731 isoform X2 [Daktulosphaira vitifoliae]
MSITVALNTENSNGRLTIGVPAHESCDDCNSIDMAEFGHKNNEQLQKVCNHQFNQKSKDCCCDLCDLMSNNNLNDSSENKKWEEKWSSLMNYIRSVYRMAMDGVEIDRYPIHKIFREAADESKSCDSYHVFQNVENLVMEFVLEARAKQVHILEKKNKDAPELPQVFVFCLLDSYRKLMAAADHLKEVLKPLEDHHLSKFNLSWRMMNQYLYHSRLYADRTIYHLVTAFIEQILATPMLANSTLSSNLIHDYSNFVKEVKLNISEWAEARTCIHNVKCNEVWAIGTKKYKESVLKESNGLDPPSPTSEISACSENSINMRNSSTPNTPPQSPTPEFKEKFYNEEYENLDEDEGSSYCDCLREASVAEESKQSISELELFAHNEKCRNHPKSAAIYSMDSFSYSNIKEKMANFYGIDFINNKDEPKDSTVNQFVNKINKLKGFEGKIEPQIKSNSIVNSKYVSTMDKNSPCSVEQFSKKRYPYPSINKPSESSTKSNNKSSSHGHACHKHTEHTKRMQHHHDEALETSSARSSQDDNCSERSTSSPRQCDCCYCEVFGHGVPSMAPVSRNYQEMRDRLRNLYLLKKAKQTVHSCNDTAKPHHKQTSTQNISVNLSNQSLQTNDKSGPVKIIQQKKGIEVNPSNSIKPKDVLKYQNNEQGIFNKPIDELVNFIEGNKAVNQKRAAKKARRREKKEEMERKKKEEEEAERKRLEEEERKKEIERLKREELLKKERKRNKNFIKQQKQVITSKGHQQKKQQSLDQTLKKKNKQQQNKIKDIPLSKNEKNTHPDTTDGAKMVTIKRDSDSSKVTITFRGAVEDDVLCTLYDNEAIKTIQRLCDQGKQSHNQTEEKLIKKRTRNRKKKQIEKNEHQTQCPPAESVIITNTNAPKLPSNMNWYCSPDVNITPVTNNINPSQSQQNTVLIKRNNTTQLFTRPSPIPSQPLPLTSPTAIQINEAVNKISSSSTPIDIEKLQLPPGITITKLDPSDYKPPRDIQQSIEKPKSLQFSSEPTSVNPFDLQKNNHNNVIVVKTDGYNSEESTEINGGSNNKRNRRRKKNGSTTDETNTENIQPGVTIINQSFIRDTHSNENKIVSGQVPSSLSRSSLPLPVIIQRHGGMVTIRNPLYQRNDDSVMMEAQDTIEVTPDDNESNSSTKKKRRRRRVKGGSKRTEIED